MNQLVLFIGEDQNHVQKLLNYLKDDYYIENIDIPEFKSTLVNQIRILKSKTNSRFEDSLHIVYYPSICYKNEELQFVLKNITQFCKQLKLIICLDDEKDIQEKTKNISQNIAQMTFSNISQNIYFIIKNSSKSNKQYQNIIHYDEKNFNKWNFISFIKQPCQLQIQQQFSLQQEQFSAIKQIYQFSQGEDLLSLFEKSINNESKQKLNLQNQAFTNIIVLLANLNQYQYKNSWKNNFKECNKCQEWIEQNRDYTTILDRKQKTVTYNNFGFKNNCQNCKGQLSYKNCQDILTQLNQKILLDYLTILDQFVIKQESSCSQSVLVLNNEILSQASLFRRLYPDINESKVQFTIGSDIQDQFYLISAPEFEFSLDQEEELSKYQKFLKQRKVNYIICCLNFQRYDLMKQRAQEMLKFLNGVNRQQIGFFIFCENAQNYEFEKVFSGFKNFVGQIQTISENDGFANIFNKIKSLVSEGTSYPEINFQNTLFQSYDEDDEEETQANYKQLAKEIEQKEIENLTSKIVKEQENQDNISQEIYNLQRKISDLEVQKRNSIYQMQDFQKKLTSLKQSSQQDYGQQKNNKKKRRY